MIAGLEALKQAVPEQAGTIDQIIAGIQAQQTAISQAAAGSRKSCDGSEQSCNREPETYPTTLEHLEQERHRWQMEPQVYRQELKH